MLSYSFVLNRWITKLIELNEAGDVGGQIYFYGMIIRNVFFYEMPEAASLTEIPVPNILDPELFEALQPDDSEDKFHNFKNQTV